MRTLILGVLVAVLASAACGEDASVPTPASTSTPGVTSAPTSTPTPGQTSTSGATSTPAPTLAPVSTPTPRPTPTESLVPLAMRTGMPPLPSEGCSVAEALASSFDIEVNWCADVDLGRGDWVAIGEGQDDRVPGGTVSFLSSGEYFSAAAKPLRFSGSGCNIAVDELSKVAHQDIIWCASVVSEVYVGRNTRGNKWAAIGEVKAPGGRIQFSFNEEEYRTLPYGLTVKNHSLICDSIAKVASEIDDLVIHSCAGLHQSDEYKSWWTMEGTLLYKGESSRFTGGMYEGIHASWRVSEDSLACRVFSSWVVENYNVSDVTDCSATATIDTYGTALSPLSWNLEGRARSLGGLQRSGDYISFEARLDEDMYAERLRFGEDNWLPVVDQPTCERKQDRCEDASRADGPACWDYQEIADQCNERAAAEGW